MDMKPFIAAFILAFAFLAGTAFTAGRQGTTQSGKALGVSFESLVVSNLERSINYYKAMGFTVDGNANPTWVKDEEINRLYNTPGAMSRTATLTIASTGSGKPFKLLLREYKGIDRGKRVDFPARNPSSAHIGLIVPEADALWKRLQAAGLLRALSWDAKLVRLPGQTSGGIAYVRDPDGFNIEIVGVKSGPAAANSLHHLGLTILDSARSKGFYGSLLGAKFPDAPPQWLSGDMYDAAVGGHGYVINLINGSFPEATAPQSEMRFELVEYQKPDRPDFDSYRVSDVAVNCVGLQVEGLDALYARLNNAGIKPLSRIVSMNDGRRAVVVRDPDVGAFVELFEK